MRTTFTIFFVFFVSVTFAQKTQIDKRAYAYYTQDEIRQMPDYKIKQINFLYQQSFIIPKEFEGQINPDEIDIRKYSRQRAPHQRIKVYLKNPATERKEQDNVSNKYIYLLSIDELQEAYENIK